MRNSYAKQNNSKLILYIVLIAAVLGIAAIVIQDIQIPLEHISQKIEVKLDK